MRVARHGSRSRYGNARCRCRQCRKAHAEAHLEYMHRTGRSRPVEEFNAERRAAVQHGTATKYNKHKCRCDECRVWAREEKRRYRVGISGVQCELCGALCNGKQGLACHIGKMHKEARA